MTLTAQDRVALILGRAVMRAEALQAENEQLRSRLAEFENGVDHDDASTASPKATT